MIPDSPSDDSTRRVIDALERAAKQARKIAAQTGTRLVVVQDGVLIAERVSESESPEDPSSEKRL